MYHHVSISFKLCKRFKYLSRMADTFWLAFGAVRNVIDSNLSGDEYFHFEVFSFLSARRIPYK